MIIERVAETQQYRYRIIVPRSNMTPINEVVDWAEQLGIKCCIFPGFAYVHTEADALLFVLRWQ